MDHIAVTEEDNLRSQLGQLRFWSGHMMILLQDFKEQYEADEVDQEFMYSRTVALLKLMEGR